MNNVKYVSTQVPITIEHFGVPGMRKGSRKQRPLNGGDTENKAEAAKTPMQDRSTSKSPAPMDSANAAKKYSEGKAVSEGYVLDIAKNTPFNVNYHVYSFSDILNSVGDNL
jgi:hypothetical protein